MAQINIDPEPTPVYPRRTINVDAEPTPVYTRPTVDTYDSATRAAATNNLTWALAVVLIIAAIAVAIVFVVNNVHP